MASIFYYVLLPILCYLIYRYKYRRIYAMVKHVDGTKDDIPLFGISVFLLGSAEHIMKKMAEYSQTTTDMGGISKAWLGPYVYFMITDPAALEVVLKNNLEKDNLHRFFQYFVGNASIFASVPIWKPRRKVTVAAFTPKVLSSFVHIFAEQSHKMANLLKPKVGTGNFKIWPYISAYNLDAVMASAMGVPLNAQDDNDNPILTAINDALKYSCERIFHPWLQPDWLYRFFPQFRKLEKATKMIHDFTDEIIKKKKLQIKAMGKENVGQRPVDLLQNTDVTFLELLISHSGGESGYTNLELREEVLTFIFAATDTSAVTMGYVLKLLGKYPKIQQKVFDELDAIFGDSDRLLDKDDLPKLQYLDRVLKETLRLFPAVPLLIRTTTEDSRLNEDIVLPKGTGIVASVYGVHRNPNVWGSDADCFDPDRFLPERMKGMHPCSFIPFSNGPRNCIGYQYAMRSMKTALSTILRRYKVVGEPEKGPVPHIRTKLDVMMKAVDGYEIALELR